MSDVTPQAAFIGNVLTQAAEFGVSEIEAIRFAVEALSFEMFTGLDREVYEGIRDVLDEGRLPVAGTVHRLRVPGLTLDVAQRYQDAAAAAPSEEWDSYTEAVRLNFTQRLLRERVASVQKALQKGELDEALTLMSGAADEVPSRASYELGFVDFEDDASDLDDEPRIQTCFRRLNRALGGGLGFRGRNVMSLWIADSGVGKSQFMMQMIPGFLAAGHRVLYCYGEGEARDIRQEITRLRAGVRSEDFRFNRKLGRVVNAYRAAASGLAALPGRLAVHDEEFSGDDVRRLAREHKRKLAEEIELGLAPKDAQLIVIIDNIDSAVTFDSRRFQREDQAYEYEARRFEQSAKREGYHLAILSQTNDEGRKRQGPPEKYDIARAKVLMNRAATIVTLHRPISEVDRTQTDRDGEPGPRARVWVAVRKTRGGSPRALEFGTSEQTEQWFDPQEPATLEDIVA